MFPGSVLGFSLFAYCENDSINNIDPWGYGSIWSLKSDWAGRQILNWYLYGGGKSRTLSTKKWGNYMKANKTLKAEARKLLKPYAKKQKNGTTVRLNIKTSMKIENGEDIIGYQYLHGTNSKVGGFAVEAFIKKDKKGKTTFTCSYIWNDMIDPNFYYYSDIKKANFAKIISFGKAKDYRIQIIWSDVSVLNSSGKWEEGWLS